MFGETFKNFTIDLDDALNESYLVSSGSLITGNISFTLKKETAISSIVMEVGGLAHVHWTAGVKHKKRISDKKPIFSLKDVILRSHEDPKRSVKLPPGTHVFPFTCQLPVGDFPSSYSAAQASIKYSAVVRIFRPWHVSKDFEKELNYVNYFSINQPHLWRPVEANNEMQPGCLSCTFGHISLTARAERQVFRPGETVKVIYSLSNASSGTITPKVKLQRRDSLHAGNNNLTLFKVLSSAVGDPVRGHTSVAQTEMLLTIPPTAPLTIANCSLLEVVYNLEVSVIRMALRSPKVLIPIILYDIPASAQHTVGE